MEQQFKSIAPTPVITGLTNLVAVHKDTTLKSLEPFQVNRDRFRGCLVTHSLSSYCDYINNKTSEDKKNYHGFINQNSMQLVTFFNLINNDGVAGQADDKAILSLQKTAAFESMKAYINERLSQESAAEYLEDWRDIITPLASDGDEINILQAIASFRNINLDYKNSSDHSVENLSTTKSSIESIEAKSKYIIPSYLKIKLAPYTDLPEMEILLRVQIKFADKPQILLRWTMQKADEELMAKAFEEVVRGKIGDKVTLTLGNFELGK